MDHFDYDATGARLLMFVVCYLLFCTNTACMASSGAVSRRRLSPHNVYGPLQCSMVCEKQIFRSQVESYMPDNYHYSMMIKE